MDGPCGCYERFPCLFSFFFSLLVERFSVGMSAMKFSDAILSFALLSVALISLVVLLLRIPSPLLFVSVSPGDLI